MTALRRQQLVRLSGEGWARVLDAPWDAEARSCLGLWAARGLPLVVTRQPPAEDDRVATGLPAPARYRRRRLAVAVAPRDVLFFDEFPPADSVTRLLPRALASAWRALVAALVAADCAPRIYGGFGWQALTRLAYVHAESDLDLLLPVSSPAHADAVVDVLGNATRDGVEGGVEGGVRSCLLPAATRPARVRSCLLPQGGLSALGETDASRQKARPDPKDVDPKDALPPGGFSALGETDGGRQKARPDPEDDRGDGQKARPDPAVCDSASCGWEWRGPRLDGELLFPDGGAVAWREWYAHRRGRAAQVMVKRLHGVALETPA